VQQAADAGDGVVGGDADARAERLRDEPALPVATDGAVGDANDDGGLAWRFGGDHRPRLARCRSTRTARQPRWRVGNEFPASRSERMVQTTHQVDRPLAWGRGAR